MNQLTAVRETFLDSSARLTVSGITYYYRTYSAVISKSVYYNDNTSFTRTKDFSYIAPGTSTEKSCLKYVEQLFTITGNKAASASAPQTITDNLSFGDCISGGQCSKTENNYMNDFDLNFSGLVDEKPPSSCQPASTVTEITSGSVDAS